MMTKSQKKEWLAGKKVYVNGKTREIQKMALDLGFTWGHEPKTEIKHLNAPFLKFKISKVTGAYLIHEEYDMESFINGNCKEVTAEEVLRPYELSKDYKDGFVSGYKSGYYNGYKDSNNCDPFDNSDFVIE